MTEHGCPYGEGQCPILNQKVVMREHCIDRCRQHDSIHTSLQEDICMVDKKNDVAHDKIWEGIRGLDGKYDGKISTIAIMTITQLLATIGGMATILFFILKGKG